MRSTGDAKIIFCINQSAGVMLRRRQREFKGEPDVMKIVKESYIKKICAKSGISQYALTFGTTEGNKGPSESFFEENLFFTDWNPGEYIKDQREKEKARKEATNAGIKNIEDIKTMIRDFLITQKVYEDDPQGLSTCFESISES